MEMAGRKFNWSDAVLVDAAKGKLSNNAKRWLDQETNVFADLSTWEKFSYGLIKHYYPKGLSASAAQKLHDLKYDDKMQLQALYDKIRELSYFQHEKLFTKSISSRNKSEQQSAIQAHEDTTFNTFKAKLPREMRIYALNQKPANSKDLLESALQYETEFQNKNDKNDDVAVAAVSRNNPQHKFYECHYCGKMGHIQKDCRTKKKDIEKGIFNGKNNNGSGRGRGYHNNNSNAIQYNGNNNNGGYNGSYSNNNNNRQNNGNQSMRGDRNGGYRGRGRGGYSNRPRGTHAVGYDEAYNEHASDSNGHHHQQPISHGSENQPMIQYVEDDQGN